MLRTVVVSDRVCYKGVSEERMEADSEKWEIVYNILPFEKL